MEQYSDELYHYGRKGMKWYQNIFTNIQARRAAKQKRQALEKARAAKEAKKREAEEKEQIIRSGNAKELQKNRHRLSDDELQRAIDRIDKEQKLREVSRERVTKGQTFVDTVLHDIIAPAATDVGKQLAKSAFTSLTNKAFNLSDEYKVHTNNKKK